MAFEIRTYREEEETAFRRVASVVFGNYQGPPAEQPPGDQRIPPEWALCAFEGGELATTYAAYPFMMRLNGGKAPVAGVTMVGTLPWFRRRGHLRAIMEHDFKRRYEERREPIAVLLASMAAIYQRYGYAVTSSRCSYSIHPRYINFAPTVATSRGTWREGTPDELPLMQTLYRDFSRGRNGYLHRAPVVWDQQVLGNRRDAWGGDAGPSLVAFYEEDGEPRGYIAYGAKWYEQQSADNAGMGQRLYVRDYAWNTFGAYRAMWDLLRSFDLVVRVNFGAVPLDDPAFDIMLDPRELNMTRGDHLLSRIIDVERALPLRPYGAEGRVSFELRDAICPWNDGRWTMEAGPEGAKIWRSKDTPELTMDVSALAQLLFGAVSPSRAVRYGRAEAAPEAPLDRWDAIFKTEYEPFCPDGF